MKKEDSIAVFDSGLGGISVLKQLKKRLPGENFIYYGDSANAPYGERTREDICAKCETVVEKLLAAGGIKCVVIACNTATSAAFDYLCAKFPEIKFIGIEPAVKWACDSLENPVVLTYATNFTINGEKYAKSVEENAGRGRFYGIGAPEFVKYVESGVTDSSMTPQCEQYIASLAQRVKEPVDAVVLGCTHFPFIGETILAVTDRVTGGRAKLFDAAVLVAENTEKYLAARNCLRGGDSGEVTLLNSDGSRLPRMKKLFEG